MATSLGNGLGVTQQRGWDCGIGMTFLTSDYLERDPKRKT